MTSKITAIVAGRGARGRDVAINRRCGIERHPLGAGHVEVMSAGVANSGNAVIGSYPRRSWLFVAPISLLDICTASLRVLSWACLGAWFFFVTKPRWQIIQSRLSMPCRCRELSKIYAGRSRSVRGRFPDSSNDRVHQHRRQQRNY